MRKVYVEVIAKFTPEGQVFPLSIIWEDGKTFEIDKVTDMRKVASTKVGGQGMRYKCNIHGRETFLWLEEGRWFVEAK